MRRPALLLPLLLCAPALAGIEFDDAGSDQYYEATGITITASPYTLVCDVKPTNELNTGATVSLSDASASNVWALSLINAATMLAGGQYRVSTTATPDPGTQYVNGTWIHTVTAKVADNDHYAVMDGDWADRGTDSTNLAWAAGIDTTTLGRLTRSPPGSWLDGALANVTIWDVALNQGEVEALAAGAHWSTIRPDQVASHWDCTTADAVLVDTVGGLDLTRYGSPVSVGTPPRGPQPGAQQ